ncbi:hypothetical protein ARMSODRAFT_275431 [Armillaria solidipes]|uniref:Secreted protein n=1 Tax=Armillaria solidipes TaxID=1076256 RepID=A0A2H3C2K8_9AGAR|nr:hypothetical protein ARMSODRAFT_275431 [Armillaria solidipes]
MELVTISAFPLLMLAVSLRPVRAGTYQHFFCAHKLFWYCGVFSRQVHPNNESALRIILIHHYIRCHAMLSLFASVTSLTSDSDEPCVWVSFIIWGLDRRIRTTRVIAFNHSYFNFQTETCILTELPT